MLFSAIGPTSKLTSEQAIAKFWGGRIEITAHPKFGYGCDAHPHGWVEILPEEFAQSHFFTYSPEATAWSRTALGDARMFFMHDDIGYALIGDYWGKKVGIYKFGCQHKYKEQNVGNCLTKYTCDLCGYTKTVDSSD